MNLTITKKARIELGRRVLLFHAPESAGLKICRRPGTDTFIVGMVAEPSPRDAIVETDNARVYCAPVAALRLDGRTLDVRTDPRGRTEFIAGPPTES